MNEELKAALELRNQAHSRFQQSLGMLTTTAQHREYEAAKAEYEAAKELLAKTMKAK